MTTTYSICDKYQHPSPPLETKKSVETTTTTTEKSATSPAVEETTTTTTTTTETTTTAPDFNTLTEAEIAALSDEVKLKTKLTLTTKTS